MISNSKTALTELVTRRNVLTGAMTKCKAEIEGVDKEICDIIKPEDVLKAKDKTHGECTAEQDGVKFTVGADKTVKWDSAKLMAVAGQMSWAQANAMFKITFEMSETNYKNLVNNVAAGLVDQKVLDAVNDARTSKIGETKLKKIEFSNSDK